LRALKLVRRNSCALLWSVRCFFWAYFTESCF